MAYAKVRITPALVSAAKDLRRASVPIADISVRLGVSCRTLAIIFAPRGRLTWAKARKVFRLYHRKGMSQRVLAKMFGVSRSAIYGVTYRETWRDATDLDWQLLGMHGLLRHQQNGTKFMGRI